MTLTDRDLKALIRSRDSSFMKQWIYRIVVFLLLLVGLFGNVYLTIRNESLEPSQIANNEFLSSKRDKIPEYCSAKCWLVMDRRCGAAFPLLLLILYAFYCVDASIAERRLRRIANQMTEAGLLEKS